MAVGLSVGVFIALLTAVCLRVRVGGGFHRGICRGVAAGLLVALCATLPGAAFGLNALTVCAAATLGAPGLLLMQVIGMMP